MGKSFHSLHPSPGFQIMPKIVFIPALQCTFLWAEFRVWPWASLLSAQLIMGSAQILASPPVVCSVIAPAGMWRAGAWCLVSCTASGWLRGRGSLHQAGMHTSGPSYIAPPALLETPGNSAGVLPAYCFRVQPLFKFCSLIESRKTIKNQRSSIGQGYLQWSRQATVDQTVDPPGS